MEGDRSERQLNVLHNVLDLADDQVGQIRALLERHAADRPGRGAGAARTTALGRYVMLNLSYKR